MSSRSEIIGASTAVSTSVALSISASALLLHRVWASGSQPRHSHISVVLFFPSSIWSVEMHMVDAIIYLLFFCWRLSRANCAWDWCCQFAEDWVVIDVEAACVRMDLANAESEVQSCARFTYHSCELLKMKNDMSSAKTNALSCEALFRCTPHSAPSAEILERWLAQCITESHRVPTPGKQSSPSLHFMLTQTQCETTPKAPTEI